MAGGAWGGQVSVPPPRRTRVWSELPLGGERLGAGEFVLSHFSARMVPRNQRRSERGEGRAGSRCPQPAARSSGFVCAASARGGLAPAGRIPYQAQKVSVSVKLYAGSSKNALVRCHGNVIASIYARACVQQTR